MITPPVEGVLTESVMRFHLISATANHVEIILLHHLPVNNSLLFAGHGSACYNILTFSNHTQPACNRLQQ